MSGSRELPAFRTPLATRDGACRFSRFQRGGSFCGLAAGGFSSFGPRNKPFMVMAGTARSFVQSSLSPASSGTLTARCSRTSTGSKSSAGRAQPCGAQCGEWGYHIISKMPGHPRNLIQAVVHGRERFGAVRMAEAREETTSECTAVSNGMNAFQWAAPDAPEGRRFEHSLLTKISSSGMLSHLIVTQEPYHGTLT